MSRPDVIVVGAGPAGAATAILLAERGLEVVVLDRATFPRPKLCGEYLSPESVRILDRLDALKAIDAAGAAPLLGMRITASYGTVLDGRYRAIDGWQPYRGHALALSRMVLDAILVDRLRAMPVDLREGVRVTDLVIEGKQVTGVETVGPAGRNGSRCRSSSAPTAAPLSSRAASAAGSLTGCGGWRWRRTSPGSPSAATSARSSSVRRTIRS